MPLPRFEKLEPDKRRRLLASAAGEFSTHGFQGASLSRIAEVAGTSKGSLYYYFEDKADLFAAVIDEARRAILPGERLDPGSLGHDDFWPELERHYFAMVERCRQEEWLAAAGQLFYNLEPSSDAGEMAAAQFAEARAYLAWLLARGQELGVVRTDLPRDLLLAVVMAAAEAADRWMATHWEELDLAELPELAGRAFELLRGMVLPPAGSGA